MPIRRGIQVGVKRFVDIVVSATGLILLFPLLGLLSLIIRVCMGRPVIFRQERAGVNGKCFTIYKFRTMADLRDGAGRLLPDERRLARCGRFLRATSLDELPELINVLWGDMSLVGPRPLHVRYRDRYSPEQRRREEVRPGMTGWSQINGRNALSWEDRFALDVWYADHWNLMLDLKICLITVWMVLRMKDINAIGEGTMSEFTGTLDSKQVR